MVLLDLATCPQSTPLFSLASSLARVENLSHVLAWSKQRDGESYKLDRVELPRLNLTFQERVVEGVTRFYSLDHANLFIPDFSGGEQVWLPLASFH